MGKLIFLVLVGFLFSSQGISFSPNPSSSHKDLIHYLVNKSEKPSSYVTQINLKMEAPPLFDNVLNDPLFQLKRITRVRPNTVPKVIVDWGSNPSEPLFFMDKEVESYLVGIFNEIISFSKEKGLKISFNTTDLFHGHLVSFHHNLNGKVIKDLIIIFHAQEFPLDIPETQFTAIKATEDLFHIFKGKKFKSKKRSGEFTKSFGLRNFVWSFKRNSIFSIDTTGESPFKNLIYPAGILGSGLEYLFEKGNTVQDTECGKALGSINFFPQFKHPLYISSEKILR